jgi:glycosyltransferase involved in cell wall biosynthesis
VSKRESSLRVCFIAGQLSLGGAERQLFYMVKALTDSHIQCCVLSMTQNDFYEEKLRQIGVPVIWVGSSSLRPIRLLKIYKYIRSWAPHVVQSMTSATNLYAVFSAKVTDTIDIGAIRSNGLAEFSRMGFLGAMSLKLPKVIIANSRQSITTVKVHHKRTNNIIFLSNVVDCDYFAPKPNVKESTFTVLSVANLRQVKRHDIFLRAIAEVRKKTENIRGCIVGSGPLLPQLTELATSLDIKDIVDFVGQREDVRTFYQRASVLLVTSDYEGMPNVILEALASGLPVVSTRAGDAIYIIEPNTTGYLSDPGDVDGLSNHILKLASDPELCKTLGNAGRTQMLERYSLNNLTSNLTAIYHRLLSS